MLDMIDYIIITAVLLIPASLLAAWMLFIRFKHTNDTDYAVSSLVCLICTVICIVIVLAGY